MLSFSIDIDKPERLTIVYKDRTSSNLFVKPDTDYYFYVDYDKPNVDITNENTDDMINLFFGKWRESNGSFTYKGKKSYELEGVDKVTAFDKEEEMAQLFLREFSVRYKPSKEEFFL